MNRIDTYIKNQTWQIKENANSGYSFSGLMSHLGEAAIKEYMLENIYPNKISDSHKKGYFHIHDLGFGIISYCSGWPLRQLLEEGFGGMPGKIQSGPPKHFRTALGQMVNFLGTLQMEFAGAQAFSSFDTYLAPYVAKDKLDYKEIKQCIQEFIYGLNIPSRFANQAPFSNLTFDWVCPEDLKDIHPKIDGQVLETCYRDYQKEMNLINKAFLEIMAHGDYKGRIFTFPIPTYNLTKDFAWDSPNAKLLFKLTAKYGTPYFQNFIASDLDPSAIRSMCPLKGETEILIKTFKGNKIMPIRAIYRNQKRNPNTTYKIFYNGIWSNARVNYNGKQTIYKVLLINGEEIFFGKEHLQPVLDKGTISAKYIKSGDYLPFNNKSYEEKRGSYDLGYMIGLYAGDGSKDDDGIVFSLNKNTDLSAAKNIIKYFEDLGFSTHSVIKNELLSVRVNGKQAKELITRYIDGTALIKEFNQRIFDMSKETRQGILDGWYQADGGNSGRIYSFSKKLYNQFKTICTSLGYVPKLDYIDKREGRLSTNKCYVFKYLKAKNRKGLFKTVKNKTYIAVSSITKMKKEKVYCFSADNKEESFILANGLETHNCRLQIDKRELLKKGNGLFGAGEQTGSIGVITLNLPKIGYESKSEEDFFKSLEKYMIYAKESLEIKRRIVKTNTDNGLIPYTRHYLASWNTYFSTIGLIGMNEMCLNFLGKDILSTEGVEFSEKVLDFMRNKVADFQEETGNLFNLEATPAEGTAYRLARIDKKQYPDIITQGDDQPYYTNSCHLPVNRTNNILVALRNQERLQTKFTGGTVFHLFLGERVSDWINCMFLVKKIAEKSKLPYFSITPTFSICPIHGYISGEHQYCPLDHTEENLKKYGVSEE